jgi:hypothetical protein
MKMLMNLTVLYTAIVFGFQHQVELVTYLLRPLFPSIEPKYLDAASFLAVMLLFSMTVQIVRGKIFPPDYKLPLDGTFQGFIVWLIATFLTLWSIAIVGLKLYTSLDESNLITLYVLFNSWGLQDLLSFLLRSEPFFDTLVKLWLTSGESRFF